MNLGKVPYVHIDSDLMYVFDFASQKHRVSQNNHCQTNYEDTLKYAKKHAAKVFYLHHMKRGRLPQIVVKFLHDDEFSYRFTNLGDEIAGVVKVNYNSVVPEYTQALELSIVKLLEYFNIEGL